MPRLGRARVDGGLRAPAWAAGVARVRSYSGLGTLVASEKANSLGAEAEQFRATAMGTVWRSRSDVSGPNNHYPIVSFYGFDGDLKGKQPIRPSPDPLYTDTVYVETEEDGNTIRSGAAFQRSQTTGDRYYTATRNYYTGDSRMAVVQKYHAFDDGRSGAWEEFRYDAMGRKIMSVTRRGGSYPYTICSVTSSNPYCPEWVERTVWDGDQVLYELRGGLNETPTGTGLFWGRVGYVHAGGIDKPLVLMGGRVPTYNWRGLPESSVWTNGRKADCSLIYSGCTTIAWPSQNSVYLKANPGVTVGPLSTS